MTEENNNSKKKYEDTTDGFKEVFDVFNRYATKKSIGQAFLDLALLFANIAQLREIVKREQDTIYYLSISAVSISIFLQILVGCCIAAVGRLNYKNEENRANLVEKLNDGITILLFLISSINVVISLIWVFTGENILVEKCSS